MKRMLPFLLSLFLVTTLQAQEQKIVYPLENAEGLVPYLVDIAPATFKGKKGIRVVDTTVENPTERKLAILEGLSFHNGIIEMEVAGEPGKKASETARGFVGIAFRIDSNASHFECFYLRPTNGRANDQVRRNHSLQYISYPDHPWHALRERFPEKYESYADLEPATWTKVKIEVINDTARLYLHGASQPSLIVNDLKLGSANPGRIGLWIGPGTEAHFRYLTVTKKD